MVSTISATIATTELQFNRWNRTGTKLRFRGSKLTKEVIRRQFRVALPSSKKRGKSVIDVVNQHRIFLWISQGKREQQTWRLALKSACGPTPSRDVCSSTDET